MIPGVSTGIAAITQGKESGFVLIHLALARCRQAYRFLMHKREVLNEFEDIILLPASS